MDWKLFWQLYPRRIPDHDVNVAQGEQLRIALFQQVGKMVLHQTISETQFLTIVEFVTKTLSLTKSDALLDLCCGNGLITHSLGKFVNDTVGIDFSTDMIVTAKRFHSRPNIEYLQMDAMMIDQLKETYEGYFNKILCYEALAYFNYKQFSVMLDHLITLSSDKAIFMFASIPDNKRKYNFYNTWGRKLFYLKMVLGRKNNGIGKWWKASELLEMARKKGLRGEIVYQPSGLYTSHYRMDFLIYKGY